LRSLVPPNVSALPVPREHTIAELSPSAVRRPSASKQYSPVTAHEGVASQRTALTDRPLTVTTNNNQRQPTTTTTNNTAQPACCTTHALTEGTEETPRSLLRRRLPSKTQLPPATDLLSLPPSLPLTPSDPPTDSRHPLTVGHSLLLRFSHWSLSSCGNAHDTVIRHHDNLCTLYICTQMFALLCASRCLRVDVVPARCRGVVEVSCGLFGVAVLLL